MARVPIGRVAVPVGAKLGVITSQGQVAEADARRAVAIFETAHLAGLNLLPATQTGAVQEDHYYQV